MNVIEINIPRDSTSVADIFGIMEQEKNNYQIQYYSVSQTTLNTVSTQLSYMFNFLLECLCGKDDKALLPLKPQCSVFESHLFQKFIQLELAC